MELKDVILSTLAEMEDNSTTKEALNSAINFEVKEKKELIPEKSEVENILQEIDESPKENEKMFLSSVRERLLVLFEGFQAPNNTNIEAKVDMTLNFLEYILATIDSRIETIEKGKKK